MANERPTQFTTLLGENVALDDWLIGVDKSDTTDHPTDGSDMKIAISELRAAMRRLYGLPTPAIGTNAPTNNSNTNWVDIAGVTWPVLANRHYWVKVAGRYRSDTATNGIQFRFNGPTLTSATNRFSIRQAANGTDSWFEAGSTDLTQNGASASVVAINTDYAFQAEAFFTPSADGTLQLQFRSEVNANTTTVQTGTYGVLFDLTGT